MAHSQFQVTEPHNTARTQSLLHLFAMTFAVAVAAVSSFPSQVLAESDSYRSKSGYFIKEIKPKDSPKAGWLIGLQHMWFVDRTGLYGGFDLSGGSPTSKSGDELFLLGGVVGGEAVLGWFLLGASVNGGLANVKPENVSLATDHFAIEPQAYLGVVLGGGFRLTGTAGYLNIPNAAPFSGNTFGIRLDYKFETTEKSVDN